ncbi:phosphatidylinositol-glycan biosynthesis class X protein [Centroberyx affinis]|uniref:phosphatidylinositol-glycan biosynthesis class X protein n=1 Tax=Centroberyx affinis TaxID=166261 RepID=UPI003A5BCB65
MYCILFSTLACLSTCHCWTETDEKNENICVLLKQWLDSTSVSMEINKQGFHREVVTTVEFSPDGPNGLKVLLVHRWPRGIYVDPYQLASLSDHSDWQVLLGSAIDLEVPAHKTEGFVTLVYPTLDGQIPRLLKTTIPIHGRYHEPSFVGKKFAFVNLEPPELLLRTDKCTQPSYLQPHTVVDAPCTADNSSICQWVKIQHQQEQGHASLQFTVGDGSLVIPVCSGTLLVTMMCCLALSKNIWKHKIF